MSIKSLHQTKPLVTHLAFARSAPNSFAGETNVRRISCLCRQGEKTISAVFRPTFVIFVMVLSARFGPVAMAQEPLCPAVGDWVRITHVPVSSEAGKVEHAKGRILEISGSSITIRSSLKKPELAIPTASVKFIEVRTAGHPRSDYMLWGMLCGVGAGAFMGLFAELSDDGGSTWISPVGVGIIYTILLAPIGILAGAAIAPGEQYEPCSMLGETQYKLTVEAVPGGVAVVVRF